MTLDELITEARILADDLPRTGVAVPVTSSSVANPSVITAARHALESGQQATIAGHSGSTPDINGTHVVTAVTADTFTIPVNVTVGGTGGTVTPVDDGELWSQARWKSLANRAEREACRRSACRGTPLLIESQDTNVIRITLATGTRDYALHAKILRILGNVYSKTEKPLSKTTRWRLDADDPTWLSKTGQPLSYCTDYRNRYLTLDREPTSDENGQTIDLVVDRLPLVDMDFGDSPEIAEHHHDYLVDGMLELAYRQADSQTFDPEALRRHAAEFARQFGPPCNPDHYLQSAPAQVRWLEFR